MIEIFELVLIGSLVGVFAGALPGVGMLTVMTISFPFLLKFDPIAIIFFYAAALSMSEFIGSVVAIHLGIMGDGSSYPAVVEGHKLRKLKLSQASIAYTACGSLVGGIVSLLLFYFIFKVLHFNVAYTFKTSVSVLMFVFAVIALTLFCKNTKGLNFFLLFIGYSIGFIGWNPELNSEILTFGIPELFSGIPTIPLIIGIIIVPEILSEIVSRQAPILTKTKIKILRFFKYYLGSSLRGSTIGFFCGFIPGLTVDVSSVAAYNSEGGLRKRKIHQANLSALVSAESANNAGVFSSMLPVILLGVPIVGSEAVLLTILQSTGFFFDANSVLTILSFVPIVFISVNIIGLIFSWPLSSFILLIYKLPKRVIILLLLSLCVYAIIASSTSQILFDILIFGIFLIIGTWIKANKIDSMPIIVGFLLQNSFNSSIFRLFNLYF